MLSSFLPSHRTICSETSVMSIFGSFPTARESFSSWHGEEKRPVNLAGGHEKNFHWTFSLRSLSLTLMSPVMPFNKFQFISLWCLSALRLLTTKFAQAEQNASSSGSRDGEQTTECSRKDGKNGVRKRWTQHSWMKSNWIGRDRCVHWLKVGSLQPHQTFSKAHTTSYFHSVWEKCCLPNRKKEDFPHIFSFHSAPAIVVSFSVDVNKNP